VKIAKPSIALLLLTALATQANAGTILGSKHDFTGLNKIQTN